MDQIRDGGQVWSEEKSLEPWVSRFLMRHEDVITPAGLSMTEAWR